MHVRTIVVLWITSLLWPVSTCSGQNPVIDSLRKIVQSDAPNEQKLSAYVSLSGRLSQYSFNETIRIAEEGLQIAGSRNDSLAWAELNRNMGVANYFKGEYERAASLFYAAAGLYERRQKAKELANVYNDIAKLYRKSRDLNRALQFYNKAMTLYQQLKDSSGVQMIYNESGVVFEYQGNYKEALRRYQASLQLATLLNDEAGKGWSYNFMGGVYVLQNKYELAEDYNLRALAIRQKTNDTFAIALSYSDLGNLYSTWGKYDRAKYYFENSNLIAEKMEFKELLSNNYAQMSQMANMTGNYKEALDYFTWHTQLKDSIFNAQKTRQIEEISTIYETSKRELQIQEQKQVIQKRNRLLFISLGVFLLGLLIAYLLYNRYKWKQQARLQTEIMNQQELAARAVLEAEEKERSRIAKDLHDGVGQMMSAARMNLSSFYNTIQDSNKDQQSSLTNIIKLVDDSCREVRSVSHSMMPSLLIQKGLTPALEEMAQRIDPEVLKIRLHYDGFPTTIQTQTETILYRVIQECINNTLKHAEAGYADISLIYDQDGISVTYEDDGKGFSSNEQKDGIGLKNIVNRIHFLKGSIEIDSSPGNGTSIVIHIPA
jgi:two-component system, NarL family, sensor kinase